MYANKLHCSHFTSGSYYSRKGCISNTLHIWKDPKIKMKVHEDRTSGSGAYASVHSRKKKNFRLSCRWLLKNLQFKL